MENLGKKYDAPLWISNLLRILFLITLIHLTSRFFGLTLQQFNELEKNDTNTHFALSCVIIAILALLLFSIIIDLFVQSYSSFKWVVASNVTVIASCLFIVGFLFGYSGEIAFAVINRYNTCRQLGLYTKVEKPIELENSTATDEEIDDWHIEICDEALKVTSFHIAIDLLIDFFAIPSHIFILAYSWHFARIYRATFSSSFNPNI